MVNFTGVTATWEQWVLLLADRHFDSVHSDRNLQRQHLDEAIERGALIIEIGDTFDLMQGRNDRRGSKGSVRPEHKTDDYFTSVIDEAIEWHKPYAHNYLLMGEGNHETSITRHAELSVMRHFLQGLKAETGATIHHGAYSGYVTFRFLRGSGSKYLTPINLLYHHGSGGNSPVTRGVINTNRRAVIYPDADIIVSGHLHSSWVVPLPRQRISERGIVSESIQHHVSLGTYKRPNLQSGWEAERGFGPPSVGGVWMRMFQRNGEIKTEFTPAQ